MATAQRKNAARRGPDTADWAGLDDAALLRLRFPDLRLELGDSLVRPDVERLYEELERRGIRFRPHVWLSTEWFSPDGVPGIAVPFFAAHPRLRRLERRMMGEVEGGSRKWRMRILRHEAGHALDTAYGLRRRADWRGVFGYASRPYPRTYWARPGSRRYVLHIGHWYAQSHPTEDFAETFAVWMQPKARWRRAYAGWPALDKLEFVDGLMHEIAGAKPRNRDRSVVAPLARHSRTLDEHYRRRWAGTERVDRRYDTWIRQCFAPRALRPRSMTASRFIRSVASDLERRVAARTDTSAYLVEHAIDTVRRRARQLDLVVQGSRRDTERQLVRMVEHVVLDMLARNREHYVL